MFSIGITTYDRRELLKATLRSVLSQTYGDFEVIVGNDYLDETLSAERLGINDSRIRFINHPRNLGELANMNALLGLSRGRYFTWQFDDDLYAPNFLEAIDAALHAFRFPACVFTSYDIVRENPIARPVAYAGREMLYTGRRFLSLYLSGRLKAMGCTGVYESAYLKRVGGVERLSDGPFALHSEYLLLIRAGLLEQIGYIDAPLVIFHRHEESWGHANRDAGLYKQAGRNLVRESVKLFARPPLRDDFHRNLPPMLELSLSALIGKLAARDGRLSGREAMAYVFSLKEGFDSLKGSPLYWIARLRLGQAAAWLAWSVVKVKFRFGAPAGLVKMARAIRARFVRHERRPFWS
ncbi:MAG: glycosyltransferase family 2 protein [Nitrospirota bacterium]